ncbi:DUF6049 family protein [Bifidobacterium oedipodis]|nr:DUF6049 family protein [Bifidobacterium sp. DSM 109957]
MLAAPLSARAEDANGTDTQTATSESQSSTQAATLTITQTTPVVTSTSGFHIKVSITNNSNETTPAGTLKVSTNTLFTFVSRSDIQNWAEGNAPIPTPDELGSASVPAMPAGDSVTVSVDVDSNQHTLASIPSWGPKPLLVSYSTTNEPQGEQQAETQAETHSFLTRSGDGLTTAKTPDMNLTVALPLTADSWQVDGTVINELVADTDEGTTSALVADAGDHSRTQTLSKHQQLQVVADPSYLEAIQTSQTQATQTTNAHNAKESVNFAGYAGIMQPSDFDITTYGSLNDAEAYESAGIYTDQWSAKQALSSYRSAIGDNQASTDTYAWQGDSGWSMEALTAAREQGYSTVIADSSFDEERTATVHTGTYVVNTEAGDVTVLKEQHELSTLTHGQATSDDATAETSDAGRLARLLAQSAFYQMEQPYTERYLLTTFDRNASAEWIEQVMSALEQADWLNLTDLHTMAQADPYSVSDSVNLAQDDQDAQSESSEDTENARSDVGDTRSALKQLTASRHDIMRMATSVLKNGVDVDALSDPQALARQDASSTAQHDTDPTAWIGSLLAAHDAMALCAMDGDSDTGNRQQMVTGARTLADTLLSGVVITPSESVSVFSESAQMPVTVSNELPYAVGVQVNSITDSMQIVTSSTNELDIPARSDAQVAFTIRVSTSGSTVAHVSLADRQGQPFGATQDTPITSVLRISDMSGFIIIGFAVLLGIVGLWRQFNRTKDPDE